jgi:transcriptional regulator with XRE-family HTH domain
MAQNNLVQWVLSKEDGESMRAIARKMNMSNTYVTNVLQGKAAVSWGFAAAVAEGFGLDPLEAFTMAGLLKKGADLSGDAQTGPEKVTTISVAQDSPVVTNGVEA